MGLKAFYWVPPGQRCVKVAAVFRGDPRGGCVMLYYQTRICKSNGLHMLLQRKYSRWQTGIIRVLKEGLQGELTPITPADLSTVPAE